MIDDDLAAIRGLRTMRSKKISPEETDAILESSVWLQSASRTSTVPTAAPTPTAAPAAAAAPAAVAVAKATPVRIQRRAPAAAARTHTSARGSAAAIQLAVAAVTIPSYSELSHCSDVQLGEDLAAVKASLLSEAAKAEQAVRLVTQWNTTREARCKTQL
jgi:hypothetical protein